MLFLNEYTIKSYQSRADTKRLMDLYAARGDVSGTVAHYIKTDGTGGVLVVERNDITEAYEAVLAYSEFLESSVTPILTAEDAVPSILKYLGC